MRISLLIVFQPFGLLFKAMRNPEKMDEIKVDMKEQLKIFNDELKDTFFGGTSKVLDWVLPLSIIQLSEWHICFDITIFTLLYRREISNRV